MNLLDMLMNQGIGIAGKLMSNSAMSEPSIWDAFIPPEDISKTGGALIDGLFAYTTIMNILYFTLVCIGLFGFSYLYHHKRSKRGLYTFGNTKKQQIVTLVVGLAVFFSVDLMITYKANEHLIGHFWKFPKADEDIVRVEVLAQQWMWNFRYAGADGVFNTVDDVMSNHELRIPKGKKVEFRISSKDVIHSFYLPNARIKVDAIPGRITRLWFEPIKTGVYDIACAEMCGTHHYQMKAKMVIYEQDEYDAWLEEAQTLAETNKDIENPDIYWGWKWEE
jgi:cytochrome c oxidase subunit 2